MTRSAPIRPLIGLTCELADHKMKLSRSYAEAVHSAGGLPVMLPCLAELADEFVQRCDGIILTGGEDPITTHWGIPVHPNAKPIAPERQRFELALLDALNRSADKPALGICLGMQLMGLHAGGALNQYLPDTLPTADQHWSTRAHKVHGELGEGVVHSHHRQALIDTGSLRVIATAPDGVIEAVKMADRPFYLGVQWHPERTEDEALGEGVIRQLVDAARGRLR